MKRRLAFPLLWALLVAMWLVLNETFAPGHVVLGALVALGAVIGFAALQDPQTRLRAPRAAVELFALVLVDVARSNIAVGRIVLHRGMRGQTAGFLEIPLELRNPVGLAALACIITATPGTSWAGYDPRAGVLKMHILDLVDEEEWIRTIKDRYERRLMEVFR
jgi:multicomponent K+:H+ antiporter subunit E